MPARTASGVPIGRDPGPVHRIVGADRADLPGRAGGRGLITPCDPGHHRCPDQACWPAAAGLGPELAPGPRIRPLTEPTSRSVAPLRTALGTQCRIGPGETADRTGCRHGTPVRRLRVSRLAGSGGCTRTVPESVPWIRPPPRRGPATRRPRRQLLAAARPVSSSPRPGMPGRSPRISAPPPENAPGPARIRLAGPGRPCIGIRRRGRSAAGRRSSRCSRPAGPARSVSATTDSAGRPCRRWSPGWRRRRRTRPEARSRTP